MNNWTIQIAVTTIFLVSSKSSSSERIVTMLNVVATKASAPCLSAPCPALPPRNEKPKAARASKKAKAKTKAKVKAKARARAKAKVKAMENARVKVRAALQQRLLSRLASSSSLAASSP